jgi:hypothetical protein
MILSTHGIVGSSIGQIDADAQAFFDRVTTAGGTLSTTEKNAVNTLVIQMKTDGIWTKMKAIYPMVGGGTGTTAQRRAACSQNLKSSSFTGTFTATGWTFASTGVKGNKTSAFMETNLFPNVSLSLNNASYTIYSRTNTTASEGDIGVKTTIGGYTGMFANTGGDFYGYIGELNNTTAPNGDSRGFFTMSRSSSTQLYFYKNGAALGTNPKSSNSSSLNSESIIIGSTNAQFSNREYAFASIGDGLTDTEASNFYTEVQAFQTTLSRQV